jgi:putative transposase
MIKAQPRLSIRRQCELLQVSRSGLYYEPMAQDPDQLALMKRIDEIHLKEPFLGSRKVSQALRTEGKQVNRKAVQRLMRLMGIESIAPKPNTSKPAPEHPVYPYLLRNLDICRPDQVWAADITYIPMAHGFAYLVAIIDLHSRFVLSWRLSNSMDTSFCLEALDEALQRFGKPEIFNTDQGSQFTSEAQHPATHRSVYRPYAELMRRTFQIDIEQCPSCGGRLKLKALVIEAHNIERLLRHLGEPLEPPKRSPACDPPYFKSQVLQRKLGDLN